jgi:hypothetical protein
MPLSLPVSLSGVPFIQYAAEWRRYSPNYETAFENSLSCVVCFDSQATVRRHAKAASWTYFEPPNVFRAMPWRKLKGAVARNLTISQVLRRCPGIRLLPTAGSLFMPVLGRLHDYSHETRAAY